MSREFSILSPEKVGIEYKLAGLGSRLVAATLDLLIWSASMLLILILGALAIAFLDRRQIRHLVVAPQA